MLAELCSSTVTAATSYEQHASFQQQTTFQQQEYQLLSVVHAALHQVLAAARTAPHQVEPQVAALRRAEESRAPAISAAASSSAHGVNGALASVANASASAVRSGLPCRGDGETPNAEGASSGGQGETIKVDLSEADSKGKGL
mmetsp:Transcript_51247/g.101993  ORF Transcript_51247/g.101993 Transcript_51247/m.101993 type:complete len:143 (-) Transcript_51247:495-923(-)